MERRDCMSDFTGRSYFLAAVYHMQGGFSHLPTFLRSVARGFNDLPYERDAVLTRVQLLQREYTRFSGPVTSETALKLMLAQDLRAIENVLCNEHMTQEIDARKDIQQ